MAQDCLLFGLWSCAWGSGLLFDPLPLVKLVKVVGGPMPMPGREGVQDGLGYVLLGPADRQRQRKAVGEVGGDGAGKGAAGAVCACLLYTSRCV